MFVYIFLLRMTDTTTSQNIDLSSLDTLYKRVENLHGKANKNCKYLILT
jgi:hypothetical protein